MNQLQAAIKKFGLNHNFIDLDLEEDEPLSPKYRFPDIQKYDGTDDRHLHLRQYVTIMKQGANCQIISTVIDRSCC